MKIAKTPRINTTRPGSFTEIIMRSTLLRLRLMQYMNNTTIMRCRKFVSTSLHPPDQVLPQDLEVGFQPPLLDVLEHDRTVGTIGLGANPDLDGLPLQGLLGAGCLPGGGIAGALLLPWGLPYRQPWPAYRSRPRGHGRGGYFPWGIPSHQPWPADGNRPRG